MKPISLNSASRPELCGVPLPPRQAGVRFPCQERTPVSGPSTSRENSLLRRVVALLLGAAGAALLLSIVQPLVVPQRTTFKPSGMIPLVGEAPPVIVYERMMDADVGIMKKVHQGVPDFFLATGVMLNAEGGDEAGILRGDR